MREKEKNMTEIKVGVIGCGYWGPNLIRNFIELPSSEVIAVADLKEDRLSYIQSRFPKLMVTSDFEDLYSLGLDAVVIATPPVTHFSIAQQCLQQNLNVLIEKPMTLNSQHALELVELAKEKDLILMVGHTFEYNPAVQFLKEIVDSGELGEVHYIDSARLNLGLFQPTLNVLWDLAPHDISILNYIMGTHPTSVSAEGMQCIFEGVYDIAYLNLMFPGNVLAHAHLSWLDPCKVRRITIVGSKKMVVYNDVESLEKIRIYDKGVDKPEYTNTFGEFQCNYRYGGVSIPNIRFIEPLRQECQHFLESITNHTQPQSDGQAGLEVVKILEAAQRSLDSGGERQAIHLDVIKTKNPTAI
jgi:predicted dehydrogenase